MKTSLISQIELIEKEASLIIREVKDRTEEEASRITKATEKTRATLEKNAVHTSEEIIKEYRTKAEETARNIVRESESTVKAVHEIAKKNREMGLKKARELFSQEYGITLP